MFGVYFIFLDNIHPEETQDLGQVGGPSGLDSHWSAGWWTFWP